jgi:hypothetical protein
LPRAHLYRAAQGRTGQAIAYPARHARKASDVTGTFTILTGNRGMEYRQITQTPKGNYPPPILPTKRMVTVGRGAKVQFHGDAKVRY